MEKLKLDLFLITAPSLCRGVSLHVGPQVASVRKGFHTNRTGVRLVSRVRSESKKNTLIYI